MSAPVSVIIPTLDVTDRIGPTLGSLGDALFDGLIREVIFADGGSSDAIAEIADATGARLIRAPRGRGAQLAAGASAARGAWLLFLHADSVPGSGWAEAVRRHTARHGDEAGYFRLAFDSAHPMARVTAAWANLRSRLFALPYGDQGLLISRALYEKIGGYPEIPLMEDVAIARKLRRRLRPLGATITTSAERYEAEGWLHRGGRNLGTLARYLLGVPPERLSEHYRNN